MILQSLVEYYEVLEKKGKVTSQGWCMAKVAFALELSKEGELIQIIPLKQEVLEGKKKSLKPQMLKVPEMVTRASGVAPNFLCDNASYLLGIDNKGNAKRTKECFLQAAKKHSEILQTVESESTNAIKLYFETWNPDLAIENSILAEYLEEILAGSNLVFWVAGQYAQEDEQIKQAWLDYYNQAGDKKEGICLVTGKRAEIARIHGTIQGVAGAQSSGAALVSFNAPAFESYGKEQSYNAPVGAYAVYAYTTALNYLLADRARRTTIGDTAVVYWSEDGEEAYQDVFFCVSDPSMDNQEIVHGVFENLSKGKEIDVDTVINSLSMDKKFYVLGLAPNAARLSVRFFYQNSFGTILRNMKAHYDRMAIVRSVYDRVDYMGTYWMLQETVNKKSREKKPTSNMAGAVYRAILSGSRYPDSLYQSIMGRIRAEQDDSDNHQYKITRGRAAIIKAFLMKNKGKEEITMALYEESENVAYTLGREFAVLEAIQEEANPGINATIKDRYFNSACATPAVIFPILFKLKNSHIRKFTQKNGTIYYEKILCELQGKIGEYPKRLSLDEQGMFILGYYHQTQKRYEKKAKEEN